MKSKIIFYRKETLFIIKHMLTIFLVQYYFVPWKLRKTNPLISQISAFFPPYFWSAWLHFSFIKWNENCSYSNNFLEEAKWNKSYMRKINRKVILFYLFASKTPRGIWKETNDIKLIIETDLPCVNVADLVESNKNN